MYRESYVQDPKLFLTRLARHFADHVGSSLPGRYRLLGNFFVDEPSREIWIQKPNLPTMHYTYLFMRDVRGIVSSDFVIDYHRVKGLNDYNKYYRYGRESITIAISKIDYIPDVNRYLYSYADINVRDVAVLRPELKDETWRTLEGIVRDVFNMPSRASPASEPE